MLFLAVTADRGPVNPERYLAASQAPEDSRGGQSVTRPLRMDTSRPLAPKPGGI